MLGGVIQPEIWSHTTFILKPRGKTLADETYAKCIFKERILVG